jgi:hypothetical protein
MLMMTMTAYHFGLIGWHHSDVYLHMRYMRYTRYRYP